MLDKIGHIKNPLTVIAMFAGIAEVSGAAVLPWLDKDVQETYVIFLMGFPCLLVLLFFVTLWAKHTVLYAPSDFKDDKNFMELFGSPNLGGFESVVSEIPLYEAAGEPDQPGEVEMPVEEVALNEQDQSPEKSITPSYAKTTLRTQALNRLGAEFGASFLTDVPSVKDPSKKFDFVLETSDATCVGTVFYSFSKLDTMDSFHVKRAFMDTFDFWKSLPADIAKKFVFAVVVVTDTKSRARRVSMESTMLSVSKKFPFEVIIKVWDDEDLSGYPIT